MFYDNITWDGRVCYNGRGVIIVEYVERERELILSQIWVDEGVVEEKIIENINSIAEARITIKNIIDKHYI